MDVSNNRQFCGSCKGLITTTISCPCKAEWDKWLCIKGCGNEVLEDRLCIRHWYAAHPNAKQVTKLALSCEHYEDCNNAEFRRVHIILADTEGKIISLCREHYDFRMEDVWVYELRWEARRVLQNTGEVP